MSERVFERATSVQADPACLAGVGRSASGVDPKGEAR